jgi:hypothetical protein
VAALVHQVGILAGDGAGKLSFGFLREAKAGYQQDANNKKLLHNLI